MSSKPPSKSDVDSTDLPDDSPDTDGTITCFWSSSDPDWYDDYVEDHT
jgi:hypothetical protein